MKLAHLEYKFLFDADEVWNSVYDFEKSLAKWLDDNGFVATPIKTIEGGVPSRMFLIERKENTPLDKRK